MLKNKRNNMKKKYFNIFSSEIFKKKTYCTPISNNLPFKPPFFFVI